MCRESKWKRKAKGRGLPLKGLVQFGFLNSRQDWTEHKWEQVAHSHSSPVALRKPSIIATIRGGNSQSIQEVVVPFLSSDWAFYTDTAPPSQIHPMF